MKRERKAHSVSKQGKAQKVQAGGDSNQASKQSVASQSVTESAQDAAIRIGELSSEIQRIQKNVDYILDRVRFFFKQSFEGSIDQINQRFHELVWKYIFRGAGTLEDCETLSVDRAQSINLWRDCISEALTWEALSYARDLWQSDEQALSEAHQNVFLKKPGSSLFRVFVFDGKSQADEFGSDKTNQDILSEGYIKWIEKSALIKLALDSRYNIDLTSDDFMDFAVVDRNSYVLWFQLRDATQQLSRAILTINGRTIDRARAIFDVAYNNGTPFSQPQKSTILFLSADPTDATRIRTNEELRDIKEVLEKSTLQDRFQLESREALRPTDIIPALRELKPQYVHFSGHGTKSGAICIENPQGKLHPVEAEALAALFKQFDDQIKCVVLNACYSKIQADAIAQYVDYVIGMTQAIDDKVAIAFSTGFYQALGAGSTIEEAYQNGSVTIELEESSEDPITVLIKKAKA